MLAFAFFCNGQTQSTSTNRFSELRDLRISCLESFNITKNRLEDFHGFLEQQAAKEKVFEDKLVQIQQQVDATKRSQETLSRRASRITNEIESIRGQLDRATTSFRKAVEVLPTGEDWATDGAAVIREIRRAADAAPRDEWKRQWVSECEGAYEEVLNEWRAARRAVDGARFDLELRAAPSVFKRTSDQIVAVEKELKSLKNLILERGNTLVAERKEGEKWAGAIQTLRENELMVQNKLFDVTYQFHLVDLRFTAWRLKQSGNQEMALEAMPDLFEKHMPVVPTDVAGIPSPTSDEKLKLVAPGASYKLIDGPHSDSRKTAVEREEKEDAAFSLLLTRFRLAHDRLEFLTSVLDSEVKGLNSAIDAVENKGNEVHSLSEETAQLAVDLESSKRQLESGHELLTAGIQTLDLVKKRAATDLTEIQGLLKVASAKIDQLSKSLEH